MLSIYFGPPSLLMISLKCIRMTSATRSANVQLVKKPAGREVAKVHDKDFLYPKNQNSNVKVAYKSYPVWMWFCTFPFLAFGLKVLIPILWFPFAKCLMKVASTLSISLLTSSELPR